ncbi:uncharacterized protein [Ptychodera flava]|uniref:uncharacterized protein isoform X3 n=1 Tax=Ptychodera flava TaxID=63121 RepID=UPI00396A60F5
MEFLGPRELYFLEDFHKHDLTSQHFENIRSNYKKSASSQWRKAEKDFLRLSDQIFVDRERTEELKAEGNTYFKKGLYELALQKYTEAIEICPRNSSSGHSCKHLDVDSHGNNHVKKQRWQVLPATLYCNRAQCLLYLQQYQNAVYDCDQAISRCLDYQVIDIILSSPYSKSPPDCESCAEIYDARRDGEALMKPLVVKAIYRRSKALYELGCYHRALVDISHCVYLDSDVPMFESHMEKVLITYRDNGGSECIKRCGHCERGEGKKLKRCANCSAIYCSRKCQLTAWEKGHKTNCGSYKKE